MAGIMLSAIISDTLLFKSPTCTEEDKKIYLEESKEVFNDVEVAEENKTLILKK